MAFLGFTASADVPYRWRGPKELVQKPESYDIKIGHGIITLPYEGPYEVCKSKAPRLGDSVVGFDGYTVSALRVEPIDESPAGRLIVTLDQYIAAPEAAIALGLPEFELEFAELSKKIETHPRCGTIKPESIKAGKSWDDWIHLDKNGGDYEMASVSGAWTWENYLTLKAAGVEDYNVAAPIARRNTHYRSLPTGLGVNAYKLQTPPAGCQVPPGYIWLATADRITHQGRDYRRSEEWIGSNALASLTELIYPFAS